MKRLVTMVTALSLIAPSVAFAQPSATAALSLKNAAAVQPVRASAQMGKKLKSADDDNTLYYVLGAVVTGVLIWCVADFCKSKSK